ncbi:hypothetical protein [Kitasatospora sp. NPDC094015]|uniref:hypothetical protein n=1 Tax=Kitasatospora sp. NPDC094015 TaxID=3155205 RepID=UPI003328B1A7
MRTTLDRQGRDQLAALVDQLPAVPRHGSRTIPVDDVLLELTAVLVGQLSAAFRDEPIGRAADVVADRLQLSVPMTSILALKSKVEARNLDVR